MAVSFSSQLNIVIIISSLVKLKDTSIKKKSLGELNDFVVHICSGAERKVLYKNINVLWSTSLINKK